MIPVWSINKSNINVKKLDSCENVNQTSGLTIDADWYNNKNLFDFSSVHLID